ncbi:uncharacterized protein LOC125940371 [Dermacentor silvarum]|uniref:uncharacterized protein LOC125940371 n=1 Tax=Dermacentor silvarum TaxID=543639 RepID=UPI002100ED2C|nr:uncharacterized protein LOC125940371 [Dermacentor silvarum]
MRKVALTNTTYNFTQSMLNESKIWQNTSYSATFVIPPTPPIEMKYNSTTDDTTYEIDMTLTYNEPDSYNCSVFTVTSSPKQANGLRTAAMYVRGPLPNGTFPPEYCQMDFLTYCYETTIYRPYNWNCSASEAIGQVEG